MDANLRNRFQRGKKRGKKMRKTVKIGDKMRKIIYIGTAVIL